MRVLLILVGYCTVVALIAERSILELNITPATQWRAKTVIEQPYVARWDAFWQKRIAENGYSVVKNARSEQSVGFFPLYPLLIRYTSQLTGLSTWEAGAMIARISAYATLLLLFYYLVNAGFSASLALAGLLVFLSFPSAYVLTMVYSEATFLALAIGAVYLYRRGHPVAACLPAFFACLTRPHGVALIAFFGVAAMLDLRHRRNLKSFAIALAPALAGAAGIVSFFAFLAIEFGDFFLYFQSKAAWNNQLSFPGWSLWQRVSLIVQWFFAGVFGPSQVYLNVFCAFLLATGTYLLTKRRHLPEAAYVAVILLLALGQPHLDSLSRYTLLAFPLLLLVPRRQEWQPWLVASGVGFALVQGLAIVKFANFIQPPP